MAAGPRVTVAPPGTECTIRWGDATVNVRCSTRTEGDFHVEQDLDALRARRRWLVDLPWSQPDEVHGTEVLEVTRPGEHDLVVADAVVTGLADAALGIWVGDCAPVALIAASGRIGGVHAGWKGLVDGVLERAVAALRSHDDEEVVAVLGPCIHPCCYEFGAADLAIAAARLGPSVVGTTAAATPALDVPAGVRAALASVAVPVVAEIGGCTSCEPDRWFSHRARAERGRQIMAIWRAGSDDGEVRR